MYRNLCISQISSMLIHMVCQKNCTAAIDSHVHDDRSLPLSCLGSPIGLEVGKLPVLPILLTDLLDVLFVLALWLDFAGVSKSTELCVVCYAPPLSTRPGVVGHTLKVMERIIMSETDQSNMMLLDWMLVDDDVVCDDDGFLRAIQRLLMMLVEWTRSTKNVTCMLSIFCRQSNSYVPIWNLTWVF